MIFFLLWATRSWTAVRRTPISGPKMMRPWMSRMVTWEASRVSILSGMVGARGIVVGGIGQVKWRDRSYRSWILQLRIMFESTPRRRLCSARPSLRPAATGGQTYRAAHGRRAGAGCPHREQSLYKLGDKSYSDWQSRISWMAEVMMGVGYWGWRNSRCMPRPTYCSLSMEPPQVEPAIATWTG